MRIELRDRSDESLTDAIFRTEELFPLKKVKHFTILYHYTILTYYRKNQAWNLLKKGLTPKVIIWFQFNSMDNKDKYQRIIVQKKFGVRYIYLYLWVTLAYM